jgi:hypothetical protein
VESGRVLAADAYLKATDKSRFKPGSGVETSSAA